jgi:HTH-type transcriptional regulator / antitoxin HipB
LIGFSSMNNIKMLSSQLKKRRLDKSLEQKSMLLNIGMSQQQYQRIESGSDTRVSTLLRVLEGLDLTLAFIPKEKLQAVETLLAENESTQEIKTEEHQSSSWSSLIDDLEDSPLDINEKDTTDNSKAI